MGHRHFGVAFVLASILALEACGGSNQEPDVPEGPHMTAAEARAFIAQAQKERGTTPETGGVTNMEQLLDVLMRDDIGRFEDAAQLVAGKPGIDAMTMHATIELSWSDGYSTVAAVVEERRKRADADVRRLKQERDAGRKFSDAEVKELEKLEKEADFETQAHSALAILAADHLQVAGAVVREVIRQFPADQRTRRVAAFYYLLSEDYADFDMTMKRLEATESNDAGLQYVRAVESLRRYGIKKDASAFLHAALQLNPSMVRAQAKLVLTEAGNEATYAELQKLKAVAPKHPIVTLAGPAIISEYETSTALARARASHQLPVAPPAAGTAPPDGAQPTAAPLPPPQ
jgi:hypothetical protein